MNKVSEVSDTSYRKHGIVPTFGCATVWYRTFAMLFSLEDRVRFLCDWAIAARLANLDLFGETQPW
jgi:hypothetical protein